MLDASCVRWQTFGSNVILNGLDKVDSVEILVVSSI